MSYLTFLRATGWHQDSLAPVMFAFLSLFLRLGKNRWIWASKLPAQVIWEEASSSWGRHALKGTLNGEPLGQGGGGRGGRGRALPLTFVFTPVFLSSACISLFPAGRARANCAKLSSQRPRGKQSVPQKPTEMNWSL